MPGKAPPTQKLTIREILNELIERTNSNIKRLRILEQNTEAAASRLNTTENLLREHSKKIWNELNNLNENLREESERIVKLELVLKDMASKLKRTVSVTKVKELEQLVDIYNPLKSEFVTKQEAEDMIKEAGISKRLIKQEE